MVAYCDGFLCKKKRRRNRYNYVQAGVGQVNKIKTKAAQKLVSNNAVPTWAQATGIISDHGGGTKFFTSNPEGALWNAFSGIGETALEGLGYATGIPILASAARVAGMVKKAGYTAKTASKAAQTFLKSKFTKPGVAKGRQFVGRYVDQQWEAAMRKGGNKPFKVGTEVVYPSRVSPMKTPQITPQKYSNFKNPEPQLRGVPKVVYNAKAAKTFPSGAGVWAHSGDIPTINNRSLNFEINRASAIPNRSQSLTARRARHQLFPNSSPIKQPF